MKNLIKLLVKENLIIEAAKQGTPEELVELLELVPTDETALYLTEEIYQDILKYYDEDFKLVAKEYTYYPKDKCLKPYTLEIDFRNSRNWYGIGFAKEQYIQIKYLDKDAMDFKPPYGGAENLKRPIYNIIKHECGHFYLSQKGVEECLYLTHQDGMEKYYYDRQEIVLHSREIFETLIYEYPNWYTMKIEEIISYLKLSRINNPVGIFLLLLPCFCAIALVVKILPDPNYFILTKILLLFTIGAILMRSAGCVINDLLDAKFDVKVARTKNRPIALGLISKIEALIFLFLLLVFAFIILMQFNLKTIITGILAFFLVLIYPLSKRITYFPQIILGFTFNLGVFMASFTILNDISCGIIILFLIHLVWTIIYDTIYAFQDLEDDLKIGTKSTAIAFGIKAKIILVYKLQLLINLFGENIVK
jgi:4-hydroxybenzoate polyprenyltransferase